MAHTIHWISIFTIFTCPLLATTATTKITSTKTKTEKSSSAGDYIKILDPPDTLQPGARITVAYRCQGDGRIGIELRIWTPLQEDAMPWRKTWTCNTHAADTELRRTVVLRLPDGLAYRPGSQNRRTVIVERAELFAWILDESVWQKRLYNMFQFSLAINKVSVQVAPPYERPEKEREVCEVWWRQWRPEVPYTPRCPVQIEVFHGVSYPVALSGTDHGKNTVIPPYTNKLLEKQRKASLSDPKFTIVLWLYVLEYCPPGRKLCSIMQRITWDDYYRTPLIFFNPEGHLHVQAHKEKLESKQTNAFISFFAIPKEQWCRIVITYEKHRWDVYLVCDEDRNNPQHTYYVVDANYPVFYDDTQGLHIFGGSEILPSFKGYIGEATIYRGKIMKPSKLSYPSPYHPMFELGVKAMRSKCETFLSWVDYRKYTAAVLREDLIAKYSCSNRLEAVFGVRHPPPLPQCAIYREPKQEERKLVSRLVRKLVRRQQHIELADIGTQIFNHAVGLIEEEGFHSIKSVVQLLKQASCYGNHDATFMLSAILNNGVGVKAQESMSHMYLMHGALDNNRLCLMTLGNKHHFGLDGLPQSYEQAYVYYKNLADRTRLDREEHKEEDLLTELVRLTDEVMLDQQTDEDGDLFNWFKHQAANGVVSAQQNMARLLFWGSQGVKRNLQAAVEYYRMSAESQDPVALHDLGIVLLKGQGVEKNVTEAKEHLSKAADMGNSGALNTLGWHALEHDKNYSLAMEYFERSYQKGNVDAAHNLGHMWLMAKTKERKRDRVKAFEYFEWAAVRGQVDSALMVALYNMRGHSKIIRSPKLGDEWARYVAEKNPAVGRILSMGLKAYKKHNWPASLLYYLIASETGIEVANFNLAYLCEENQDGIVHYVEKECVWRNYNMTLQRHPNDINPYALIKMADYYWYACEGHKDPQKAAELYSDAAKKGDPQALFNLAFMVEEGVKIAPAVWKKLRVPRSAQQNNITLLTTLYSRCQDSRQSEAYFPCMMAKYRVQMMDIWERHNIVLKLSTFAGIILTIIVTATSMYHYFRGNHVYVDSV